MKASLIIKGSLQDAIRELRQRRISYSVHAVLSNEIVVTAYASAYALAEWLNQEPYKAPYPRGALLCYTPKEASYE